MKKQVQKTNMNPSAISPSEHTTARPPVVVVMGHIDHGKSTLLDYIRKTNIVSGEAGGITQHVSAYEFVHKTHEGKEMKMTFLDTPGHESFSTIRERGGIIADIAILVVSAEDSVKAQTIEAIKVAKDNGLPFIVAINKIDKEGANIEKTKMDLVEKEVYLEGYGGDVPFVGVSAKTGAGINELLDLVVLLVEMKDFKTNTEKNAEGIILESHIDPKRGISATIIVKDGKLKKGNFVASGTALAPTRIFENFLGKSIEEAVASSPVRIIGWSEVPKAGEVFLTFAKKSEAEDYAVKNKSMLNAFAKKINDESGKKLIALIIKADATGSIEALEKEAKKLENEQIGWKIIKSGIGPINENDVKMAMSWPGSIIVGFNAEATALAIEEAGKTGVFIKTGHIIYEIKEWMEIELERQRPRQNVEDVLGTAKILKTFKKTKERQVVGGCVISGKIISDGAVKIKRRDAELGSGRIVGLECGKTKVREVGEGSEFGVMIETKIEIVPGDVIESFSVSQK